MDKGRCEICGCQVDKLFKHHVLPKCLGGTAEDIAFCCWTCSRQVHALYSEKELAAMTLAQLCEQEDMKKYIAWKRRHPGDHRHMPSNRLRKRKKRRH